MFDAVAGLLRLPVFRNVRVAFQISVRCEDAMDLLVAAPCVSSSIELALTSRKLS